MACRGGPPQAFVLAGRRQAALVGIAQRLAGRAHFPQESFSPVMRLNTGRAGAWSSRSAAK